MTKPISRRRFISICGMAGLYSALPLSQALAFKETPLHHWSGILMGAEVSLSIAHPSKAKADEIFRTCVTEIQRLENILTLYDSHSEVSRLNKNGVLESPSRDFIDLLNQAKYCYELTDGAFDITAHQSGSYGFQYLDYSDKKIAFAKEHMKVTLNGIAQGYITDCITLLLKDLGLRNVLVELGEKRSLGRHPSDQPWRIALPDHDQIAELDDLALATSSSISPDTGKPHIIDPIKQRYIEEKRTISVVAKTATLADSLSTGFITMPKAQIDRIASSSNEIQGVYLNKNPMI
tara:strand:+ start:1314 stop:2189 length:876 start_codon:yes stop_codon:yes gene_type:complete